MPDQDVLAAIGLVSDSLLGKLSANAELCNNVMALTSVLAAEMKGANAKTVRIGDVEMHGRQMVALVKIFRSGEPPANLPDLPGKDSLLAQIGAENAMFYEFVKTHPDVIKWIRQVVVKMETYSLQTGKPFAELTFGDRGAFVERGSNNIVLELQP